MSGQVTTRTCVAVRGAAAVEYFWYREGSRAGLPVAAEVAFVEVGQVGGRDRLELSVDRPALDVLLERLGAVRDEWDRRLEAAGGAS
jgi:hypothetical protein